MVPLARSLARVLGVPPSPFLGLPKGDAWVDQAFVSAGGQHLPCLHLVPGTVCTNAMCTSPVLGTQEASTLIIFISRKSKVRPRIPN